jgi:hypothetical protein
VGAAAPDGGWPAAGAPIATIPGGVGERVATGPAGVPQAPAPPPPRPLPPAADAGDHQATAVEERGAAAGAAGAGGDATARATGVDEAALGVDHPRRGGAPSDARACRASGPRPGGTAGTHGCVSGARRRG